jgi:uncharacterized protein (DUF58 family)
MLATRRLIALVGIGALVLAAGLWDPGLIVVGACYNAALAAALLLVYALARRRPSAALEAWREVSDPLSLGAPNRVAVALRSRARGPLRVVVKDRPPPELEHDARDTPVSLPAGHEAAVSYHITPRAKGDYRFGDIALRVTSPLGLFLQQHAVPAACDVRVYPNVKAVARYDLLARRGRLLEAGIRASRHRGRGTEFESLRTYLPDDDSRHINWKATARRRQLITSQFEAERRQNLLLVLDAGRMMAGRIALADAAEPASAEMTKLDYAINAALMCAYVAATMGDRVGLLAFAEEVTAYLPPRPGRGQVFRILEQLYRLEPRLVEPDYDAALHYLALHERRRSLVILFTDLVDPDSSERLLGHVGALHPHHLVLCCTLADADLLRLAHLSPHTEEEVYRKAVAMQVISEREAALTVLRRRGVQVVDAPADQLTAHTINRYLELKARSLV